MEHPVSGNEGLGPEALRKTAKEPYTAPRLVRHGNLTELTAQDRHSPGTSVIILNSGS